MLMLSNVISLNPVLYKNVNLSKIERKIIDADRNRKKVVDWLMKIILKITWLLMDYIIARSGFSILLSWRRFFTFLKETVVSVCGFVRILIGCHFMVLNFSILFFCYCDKLVKKFMRYFTVVIFHDIHICFRVLYFSLGKQFIHIYSRDILSWKKKLSASRAANLWSKNQVLFIWFLLYGV